MFLFGAHGPHKHVTYLCKGNIYSITKRGVSTYKSRQKLIKWGLSYLINQTPGEKLRHGVALRASVTLVKSCELLGQLDYFTLVL